jgi:hypothetical protein
MEQVLIITSAHDLPTAERLAPSLGSYRTYFFDPTLVDTIAASTLQRAELLLWEGGPSYAEREARAYEHVRRLERALDEETAALREALQPGLSLQGWQALNLYYLMMSWQWYEGLWRSLEERLRGTRPHILVCDNPASFYWPSFVPALLLMQQLRTWDIAFKAWVYGERGDESDVMINLYGAADGTYDVLTHLPTCFYDAGHFNAELAAAGCRTIDIVPKYWEVPMNPDTRVNLARLDHAQLAQAGLPSLGPIGERMLQVIHALLEPYIATVEYRARQAVNLARQYQAQLASLLLLERYFGATRPGRLLVSDHDAGFHGPLLAYAARHRIPVYVLPHSKISISSDFSHRNMTALSHVMQGMPMLDATGRAMRHLTLAYPERLAIDTAQVPLRRLGVLLNGLSLNGVQCTEWRPYLDGLVQIAKWCRSHGVALSVRCRPGQTLYELIAQSMGISRAELEGVMADSLANFAAGVDACLMYDAPTTAAIEFLRNGIPILNPLPESLSKAENLWSDAELIPRDTVDGTLRLLDAWVADADLFNRFRRTQFARYAGGTAQARSLRSLL